MFRKYEKTYRVANSRFVVAGKHILSKKDVRALLVGKITIEVKEVDEDGVHWRTRWDPRKVNRLQNAKCPSV